MNTVANKIKLSKETFDILKNYSSINSNIFVKKGNVLATISPTKNILSVSNVVEHFDVSFGIWDLPKFLGTLSIFNDPELEFYEKFVLISNGIKTIQYYYSDPKLLTTPTKSINMPNIDVSFMISNSEINELKKASSILGVSDLTVHNNENGELFIKVHDKKDPSSNCFTIPIDSDDEYLGSFNLHFLIENLKLLSGDYKVNIASNVVSCFSNINTSIHYWIALEMDSFYKI